MKDTNTHVFSGIQMEIRREGLTVRARLSAPELGDGEAIEIGSINARICAENPQIAEAFGQLMRDVAQHALSEVLGKPDVDVQFHHGPVRANA